MRLGQVWSKADCDGTNEAGHQGGRGSVLAVTAQNPGPDDDWDIGNAVFAPLNANPANVTIDASTNANCSNLQDRVRNFGSMHRVGALFVFADGSVHLLIDEIDMRTYRALSTMHSGDVPKQF